METRRYRHTTTTICTGTNYNKETVLMHNSTGTRVTPADPHRSCTGGGARRVPPGEMATAVGAGHGGGSRIGDLGERVEGNGQMGDWRRRSGGGAQGIKVS
jgi:hypothetical protein